MRDKHRYTLRISKRDYQGVSEVLAVAGNVFTISQGDRDSSELQAILASELSIELLCLKEGNPYVELFTLDPLGYKVELYQTREGEDGAERTLLMWNGYLANGVYQQQLSRPPYHVSLLANDGFGALKSVPFVDSLGERITTTYSVRELLGQLLGQLGTQRVDIWAYDPIVAGEVDSTFSRVGITAEAIYEAFGENTPTCYDVLESVLQTFGLQLFQSYGRWVVRSAQALVEYTRPESFQHIAQGFNIAERDAIEPMYEHSAGRGVLSTAMLSIERPLAKLSVERDEDITYASPVKGMVRAERWLKAFVESRAVNQVRTYDSNDGTVRMRLHLDGYAANAWCGQAFIFDGRYSYAPKVDVNISIDLYNRANEEREVCLGFFAISADIDPTAWTMRIQGDYRIIINDDVMAWIPDASKWVMLKGAEMPMLQFVNTTMARHTLQPSEKSYRFAADVSTWLLASNTLTFEAKGLPDLGDDYKLMFVVLRDDNTTPLEFNLGNPKCEIRQTTMAVSPKEPKEMLISDKGVESESYRQRYADSFAIPVSGVAVPAIVDVESGHPIDGFISPTVRGRLADVVAEQMRALRGNVHYTIEGDMLAREPIDFNTLLRDDDGRVYRPIYIASHLKEQSYEVQLREVVPLREGDVVHTVPSTMRRAIGLDSSAVMLSDNGLELYHFDTLSGEIKVLSRSIYPKTLTKGYNCVCVAEEIEEGNTYHLYAYDNSGKLLSTLRYVLDAVSEAPTSPQDRQLMARTAKYNELCQAWVMVGNITDSESATMRTYILDGKGDTLAEVDEVNKLGNVMSPDDIVLTANGYFVNVYSATASAYIAVLHCDFSRDELGEYDIYRRGDTRVLAATTQQMVIKEGNAIVLYAVTDIYYAKLSELYRVDVAEWQFEDLNSALSLFRYKSGGGIIYDARSMHTTQLTDVEAPAVGRLWLSGCEIWREVGGGVRFKRIRLGEDDTRFAIYITADGARYITTLGGAYAVRDPDPGYRDYKTADGEVYITNDNESYLTKK